MTFWVLIHIELKSSIAQQTQAMKGFSETKPNWFRYFKAHKVFILKSHIYYCILMCNYSLIKTDNSGTVHSFANRLELCFEKHPLFSHLHTDRDQSMFFYQLFCDITKIRNKLHKCLFYPVCFPAFLLALVVLNLQYAESHFRVPSVKLGNRCYLLKQYEEYTVKCWRAVNDRWIVYNGGR